MPSHPLLISKGEERKTKTLTTCLDFSCLAVVSTATTNTTSTTHHGDEVGHTSSPTSSPNNNRSTVSPAAAAPAADGSTFSAAAARNAWAIRPGYSSGASSFSGSDTEFDNHEAEALSRFDLAAANHDLNVSTHSDILALGTLRQEMIADGDLAKAVVRIEVRLQWFAGL